LHARYGGKLVEACPSLPTYYFQEPSKSLKAYGKHCYEETFNRFVHLMQADIAEFQWMKQLIRDNIFMLSK